MVLSWGADRGGWDYKGWIHPVNVSHFRRHCARACVLARPTTEWSTEQLWCSVDIGILDGRSNSHVTKEDL